jgi:hypothetical protein
MQKTQVCMFCRYRQTLSPSHGPASCCAGEAGPAEKMDADRQAARPTPDRLRAPAPRPQAHR